MGLEASADFHWGVDWEDIFGAEFGYMAGSSFRVYDILEFGESCRGERLEWLFNGDILMH